MWARSLQVAVLFAAIVGWALVGLGPKGLLTQGGAAPDATGSTPSSESKAQQRPEVAKPSSAPHEPEQAAARPVGSAAKAPLPNKALSPLLGDPQALRERFADLRQARAELLQNRLDEEPQDPQWQRDMQKRFEQLGSMLPQVKQGVQLSEADCRQTLCGLHFTYSDDESKARMEPLLAGLGRGLGQDAWVYRDKEQPGTLVFVARPGEQLPKAAESADAPADGRG